MPAVSSIAARSAAQPATRNVDPTREPLSGWSMARCGSPTGDAGAAAGRTAIRAPALVTVPVRSAAVGFGETRTTTAETPLPLPPAIGCSHAADVPVVNVHRLVAPTSIVTRAPCAGTVTWRGPIS